MTTENTIRQPKQARSIEKKKKIIDAGIALICKKGYLNTTTADIAKEAHVSTGIIYSYFRDKKDILMAGLDSISTQMEQPLFDSLNAFTTKEDFMDDMSRLLDQFVEYHRQLEKPHQELAAIASFEPEVALWLHQFEEDLINNMVIALGNAGVHLPNQLERLHIALNIVENYCHEMVFHPNEKYDYAAVKVETLRCIQTLMQE